MKILVLNSGSSSMKYGLFDMLTERLIFSGQIGRIGMEDSEHEFGYPDQDKTEKVLSVPDHTAGLREISATITDGPLASLSELTAVAHRTGNGGKYMEARITPEVMEELERMVPIMPLHQPFMIREIKACLEEMPDAIHVSVPDCWFHSSLPPEATVYGLPYEYYENGYRRVGYHGSSHPSAAEQAAAHFGKTMADFNIISCHLGNGASLCAIDHGRSVDTTMGITPLEGLIMGTRSGDVDPGLIPVIMKDKSLSPDQMIEMLYKHSGLLGLSGKSLDMREIQAGMEAGDERCDLAFKGFCYRVKRYIGAMLMALGECDILLFTGGIGENSPDVRAKVLEGCEKVGFALDPELNKSGNSPSDENPVSDISAASSKSKVLVVNTFEELILARKCREVVERSQ